MTILLFCLIIEMLFSSHVMLGNYSLTIEFYWSKYSANLDLESRVFTAFCALLSLFIGLSVCVCQLWLPVWLDFLSSLLCGSNDRRRTTHIFGFVLVTLSLLLREKKGVASEKRHVTA